MTKEEAGAVKELLSSPWWKVLEKELWYRIEELENILFISWKEEEEYERARIERKAIKCLLEEPISIVNSF